jgi:membrane protein
VGLVKNVKGLSDKIDELDEREDVRKRANPFIKAIFHTWKYIQITIREIVQDQIPLHSMMMTFATLLTIVPILAISFNLFRFFGGAEWFSATLRPLIMDNLAPGIGPKVSLKLEDLIESAGSATIGGLGVILLVVAVYVIFSGIEKSVNRIWGVNARVGVFSRLPLYWGLITIVPILVVGSLAFSTYLLALPIIDQAVQSVEVYKSFFSRALTTGMVILGFFLLYRFVPSTKVKTKSALIGATIAGLIYESMKAGFIIYTTDLVQYDVIYGSLAFFPLLLIWVNLSWIVVLGGVEFCFVSQHYNTLLNKPKRVKLSRAQKDAIAYQILHDATIAFEDKGEMMTLEDWADRWKIPPTLATETAERLRQGGFIERAGKDFSKIILTRSPDKIKISEIEGLLLQDTLSEWKWPKSKSWGWMQLWLNKRKEAYIGASECGTLTEFVALMDEKSKDIKIKKSSGKLR